VAAGRFSSIGADSVPASNIARLDNTGWHALGTGTNDEVDALRINRQHVQAGGRFRATGDGSRVMGCFGVYDPAYVYTSLSKEQAGEARLQVWPDPSRDVVHLKLPSSRAPGSDAAWKWLPTGNGCWREASGEKSSPRMSYVGYFFPV